MLLLRLRVAGTVRCVRQLLATGEALCAHEVEEEPIARVGVYFWEHLGPVERSARRAQGVNVHRAKEAVADLGDELDSGARRVGHDQEGQVR